MFQPRFHNPRAPKARFPRNRRNGSSRPCEEGMFPGNVCLVQSAAGRWRWRTRQRRPAGLRSRQGCAQAQTQEASSVILYGKVDSEHRENMWQQIHRAQQLPSHLQHSWPSNPLYRPSRLSFLHHVATVLEQLQQCFPCISLTIF